MIGMDNFPEKEVLGSILSGADIPTDINAAMFFSSRNKIVFTALKNLKQKCDPDLLILGNYLEEKGLLEEAGGAVYIAELTSLVPGTSNIVYYCEKLREVYQGRTTGTAIRVAGENISKGGDALAIGQDLVNKLTIHEKPAVRKTSWTATELLDMEFPEVQWIIPTLISMGLTVLAGALKLGKSWFVLNLAMAAAAGSYALGKISVGKTGVLYLALEDNGRRLQDRLKKLNSTRFDNLIFETEWKTGTAGLAVYLRKYRDIRFVIIDTWGKFVRTSDQSDYFLTTQQASELKAIADELDIAILLVHHTRKGTKDSSGDWVDSVLGSQGLSGAADSTIVLRRRRGSNQAELLATGRDIEEQELVLSLDLNCGGWTIDGNKQDIQESKARQDILNWIRENGPHSPTQIYKKMTAEGVERSLSTVKTLLVKMYNDGTLINNNGIYSVQYNKSLPLEIPPGFGAEYDYTYTDFRNKGYSHDEADTEARKVVRDYAIQKAANL